MMRRKTSRRVVLFCVILGIGWVGLFAEPVRQSYQEYLKKHPTPTPKKSPPRIGKDGIVQDSENSQETNGKKLSSDDAAALNKKKDARRTALAKEIARQQTIMDAYEKQNSAANRSTGITEEQYLKAKAARDRAQAERNDLAR